MNRSNKTERRVFDNHPYFTGGIILVMILCVVMLLRHFGIASYCVSTDAMRESLRRGDLIVVNKIFTDHSIKRGQVLLLASPLERDSVDRPLFLSRCVALPGDTVSIDQDGYTINRQKFPFSPRALLPYHISFEAADNLKGQLDQLKIPVRHWEKTEEGFRLRLTPFESYLIQQKGDSLINHHLFRQSNMICCSFVVPQKNRAYRLDTTNLPICWNAIRSECDKPLLYKENKLYIDGKETEFFFFQQDYYWVLSDNTEDAIDSRHLGFIPRNCLIGLAILCWYSPQNHTLFSSIK